MKRVMSYFEEGDIPVPGTGDTDNKAASCNTKCKDVVLLATLSSPLLKTSVSIVDKLSSVLNSDTSEIIIKNRKICKISKVKGVTTNTSPSSKYHTTLFKVPYHPLQSTTPPSSKYHITLFKVPHHPLQSTTPPSSKYHTTLFKVQHTSIKYHIRHLLPGAMF